MSDDIVVRLRRAFEIWLSHGEVDDLAWRDAAGEIERLRERLYDAYCMAFRLAVDSEELKRFLDE